MGLEHGGTGRDGRARTQRVGAILQSYAAPCNSQHVYRNYERPGRGFRLENRGKSNTKPTPPARDVTAPYHLAFALADRHGWHISLPRAVGQFLLGRRRRPGLLEIDSFEYDQPETFCVTDPFRLTLTPALDQRLFRVSAASQALLQHVQAHPVASDDELLDDARFAAASWLGEPAMRQELEEDLTAGLLHGQEELLANAIHWAARYLPKTRPQAPSSFYPSAHEADAARIRDWSFIKGATGEICLRAARIENHPEYQDHHGIEMSTPLVWYDLDLKWARTRSRYYQLLGD